MAVNVFPARAGVIPVHGSPVKSGSGFPRTRGGDPAPTGGSVTISPFSPHARG